MEKKEEGDDDDDDDDDADDDDDDDESKQSYNFKNVLNVLNETIQKRRNFSAEIDGKSFLRKPQNASNGVKFRKISRTPL